MIISSSYLRWTLSEPGFLRPSSKCHLDTEEAHECSPVILSPGICSSLIQIPAKRNWQGMNKAEGNWGAGAGFKAGQSPAHELSWKEFAVYRCHKKSCWAGRARPCSEWINQMNWDCGSATDHELMRTLLQQASAKGSEPATGGRRAEAPNAWSQQERPKGVQGEGASSSCVSTLIRSSPLGMLGALIVEPESCYKQTRYVQGVLILRPVSEWIDTSMMSREEIKKSREWRKLIGWSHLLPQQLVHTVLSREPLSQSDKSINKNLLFIELLLCASTLKGIWSTSFHLIQTQWGQISFPKI